KNRNTPERNSSYCAALRLPASSRRENVSYVPHCTWNAQRSWRDMEHTFEAAILRRRQVEAQSGLSRSSIYANISRGLWTKPVNIGQRAVGWPLREIEALNRARIAGWSDDRIRHLVSELESDRASQSPQLSGGLR